MYMLPTAPIPLALASTWVSVEKLSRPEPGLPLLVTPVPVTPGARVTNEIILRPANGRLDRVSVESVSCCRVSPMSKTAASVFTFTS